MSSLHIQQRMLLNVNKQLVDDIGISSKISTYTIKNRNKKLL